MEEKNYVELIGKVKTGFVFSHSVGKENFYEIKIEVPRTSGEIDVVRLIASDAVIMIDDGIFDKYVYVAGCMKTYNKKCEDKNKLIIYVYVEDLEVLNEEDELSGMNVVKLDGFICKKQPLRETPKSGRKITDISLAVNSKYGNSYYIPCVCWNKNAIKADQLSVGSEVVINGRFQSRMYMKDGEPRTAFEISVQSLDVIA